jgi:3-isopropylmalate/(R)-2-methylmalate dehydratase large subunit
MTLCNMSIEAGARAGLVAVDETTLAYLATRPTLQHLDGEELRQNWRTYVSDDDAVFDAHVTIDASTLAPYMTWGTNPSQVVPVTGHVPEPSSEADERALAYMDLSPGTALSEVAVDVVFLGSCTNSRIEDLRVAAEITRGHHVASGVRALVVPGSHRVKAEAEREGLDQDFLAAGWEWREPGCSMCLGMNPDQLAQANAARQRLIATSRVARAVEGAPISCRRPSRRRRRSSVDSPPRRT